MRVVADTNVLVSALIFPGGSPEAFYRLVLEGRIELVTSRPLLVELGRVLTAKFGWEPDRAEEAIGQLVRLPDIVEPQETVIEIGADPPTTASSKPRPKAKPTRLFPEISTCLRAAAGAESRSRFQPHCWRPSTAEHLRNLRRNSQHGRSGHGHAVHRRIGLPSGE